MLNKDGQRELCYVVRIDDIKPIEGKDRVECAVVGGWTVMVRKEQFKPGDLGIYFEIDSKVPATEPFEFLAKKKYKIKTQKYGNFYSQGLLMSAEDFGGESYINEDGTTYLRINNESYKEGDFLTEKLGVTYSVVEDNSRKRKSVDKYQKMAQRMGKKFSKQPYKWLMKRTWGKKLLFMLYGRKADSRKWPEWVTKTDEERVENMTWILNDKNPWIATEKIDGTSTTFTMRRLKRNKFEFLVCSRNVVFDKPDKQCYYDTNVYLEMAEKYNIETNMKDMFDFHPEWEWVTIQGETYGAGIQKNTYDLDHHNFAAFNLVTSDKGRWNSVEMKRFLEQGYSIPCVPIIDFGYILPDTIEELREFSHNEMSTINGKIKEGIVFRSEDATKSFKCVDPEYLIKWHA